MAFRKWIGLFILLYSFISCTTNKASFWEKHKANFRYTDATEFVIDSQLEVSLASLTMTDHSSISRNEPGIAYLFSWQNRTDSNIAFTVIRDEGEHGLHMSYLVLNKRDSLISSSQVAGLGFEGGFRYETRSRVLSADSILRIGAISAYSTSNSGPGDSTFTYLHIRKNGTVSETKFSETIRLNYDSLINGE